MNRYDSYKDSGEEWVGKIPISWDVTRVKKHFNERNEKVNDIDFPPLSVTKNGIFPQLDNVSKSDNHNDRKRVCKNDFVINSRSDRKGSSGLSQLDGSVSLINIVLEPKSINPSYSEFLFKSKDFIEEFFRNGKGIHWDLWSTRYSELQNIKIPFPPLSEQQKIVSFLDTKTSLIDSLIEKTQRKIELLKEKRTSFVNEVVTKGLNPNVEMKDCGVEWIGEIPIHWGKIKFHTLVTSQKLEFQDGNHGGLHPIPDEFLEKGVPFIKPKDIQKGKVLWDSCDRLPFERCEQFRIGFSNNDDVLLVNRGGSIGKVVYVSDYDNEFPYFVINPQVTYMRGKNGLLSKYLFYVSVSDIFQCGIDLIMGHGSTFPFLGLSNMGDFEVIIPPVSEQQQIVEYLDEQTQLIDNTTSIEEKRMELLKEYRQSLISEVVTGKLKVTTDE